MWDDPSGDHAIGLAEVMPWLIVLVAFLLWATGVIR
jgi:hypothetical protein